MLGNLRFLLRFIRQPIFVQFLLGAWLAATQLLRLAFSPESCLFDLKTVIQNLKSKILSSNLESKQIVTLHPKGLTCPIVFHDKAGS